MPREKLLLAGRGGEPARTTLVRLRPDGELDRSFGRRGVVRLGFGYTSSAKVLVRHGRGILVGGFRTEGPLGGSRAFVLRVRADGSVDRSFGRRGHFRPKGMARPLAILPSSRGFTVVGTGVAGGVVLRAFDRHGNVDRGFGHRGGTLVGPRRGPFAFLPIAATLQPDGRIAVVGNLGSSYTFGTRVQLLRFR